MWPSAPEALPRSVKRDAAGGKPAQSLRQSGFGQPRLVQPEAASGSNFVPTLSPLSLLTVREAAGRLGVCTTLVYRACERGELRYTRVGAVVRIAPEDLVAFIARRTGAP